MRTHTPGPWFVAFAADGVATRHAVIVADGATQTASDWNGNWAPTVARAEWRGDVESTNANARLIAAAPLLLEALRDLVACTARTYDNRHELNAALDAIESANGSQA